MAAGRPVELDAHLARLAASARELFGAPAMARVLGPARALAEARARRLPSTGTGGTAPLGRLRLTLAADAEGALDLAAVAAAVDPALVFPAHAHGATLVPVTVAGGLGSHKWADRRLLDDVRGAVDGALPLIVDGDGAVLEAERANVFAVHAGVLATPPADGRILPGIARARVIEIAHELGIAVREQPLALDDLLAADDVFLTGSVRGVEPVVAVERTARQPGGEVAGQLAVALRERWLRA